MPNGLLLDFIGSLTSSAISVWSMMIQGSKGESPSGWGPVAWTLSGSLRCAMLCLKVQADTKLEPQTRAKIASESY
eukprot:3165985-Amphidinium_carterae.1